MATDNMGAAVFTTGALRKLRESLGWSIEGKNGMYSKHIPDADKFQVHYRGNSAEAAPEKLNEYPRTVEFLRNKMRELNIDPMGAYGDTGSASTTGTAGTATVTANAPAPAAPINAPTPAQLEAFNEMLNGLPTDLTNREDLRRYLWEQVPADSKPAHYGDILRAIAGSSDKDLLSKVIAAVPAETIGRIVGLFPNITESYWHLETFAPKVESTYDLGEQVPELFPTFAKGVLTVVKTGMQKQRDAADAAEKEAAAKRLADEAARNQAPAADPQPNPASTTQVGAAA